MPDIPDHPYRFPKAERITSERSIQALFADGCGFIAYPLRVIYLLEEATHTSSLKVLISVSKRRYKHAVDRNRVKRWIREAYRIERYPFTAAIPTEKQLLLAFVFVGKEESSFVAMRQAMHKAMKRLQEEVFT